MLSFIGIIPARYASTRFPGKPLADIRGKSMIRRVYEKAAGCLVDLVVATDDERIRQHVEDFGGHVVMTSVDHCSGTDRCAEALGRVEEKQKRKFDVVINIQGDEPFISTGQIELLKNCFDRKDTQIATLIRKIREEEIVDDPNKPKVVTDKEGFALYFSRFPVPYLREIPSDRLSAHSYYQHIGLYAYRSEVLKEIAALPQSSLEKAESLEQLRWLEEGYKIKTAITDEINFGIDTPGDLEEALRSGMV